MPKRKTKKKKSHYPTIHVVPQGRDIMAIDAIYRAFVFGPTRPLMSKDKEEYCREGGGTANS